MGSSLKRTTRSSTAKSCRNAALLVALCLPLIAARPASGYVGGGSGGHAGGPPAVTVVIDPGHNRYANTQLEPIGPGSHTLKIKDGGGTHGVVTGQTEASVNLRIGLRVRALLQAAGVHVVMTRTTTCCVSMGNIARAQIANRSHAALFLRIHADGSLDHSAAGTSMLYPAWHRGWTDDIYARSLQAARLIHPRLVGSLGWPNRGLVARSDLTGFNWSNVPAVLTEVGFLTNPGEDRALATQAVVARAATGLRNGVLAYLHARGLR